MALVTIVMPEGGMKPLAILMASLVYYLAIIIFCSIIYKVLPKKFFEITKGKIIALVILFIIPLIVKIRSVGDAYRNPIVIANIAIDIALGILALFLIICAFVFLYYQMKKKRLWKDKKELVASILIILLLNGITLRFFMTLLFVIVSYVAI